MQTCRFCKSWKDEGHMIKYGVRHYAHFDCYLDSDKSLENLSDWQILKFPYGMLKDRGLLHIAKAAQDREAKHDQFMAKVNTLT